MHKHQACSSWVNILFHSNDLGFVCTVSSYNVFLKQHDVIPGVVTTLVFVEYPWLGQCLEEGYDKPVLGVCPLLQQQSLACCPGSYERDNLHPLLPNLQLAKS